LNINIQIFFCIIHPTNKLVGFLMSFIVKFIILDLDTPGGEVFSAQKISKLLQDVDTLHNIPVICFINDWAISAGAMLAYSSRFIFITNKASMGAAQPVIAAGNQLVPASEKMVSALRSEFSNIAAFYNRDSNLAKAMVDKDLLVVLRKNKILTLQQKTDFKKSDFIISDNGKLLTFDSKDLMKFKIADIKYFPKKSNLEHPIFEYDFFKKIPNKKIIKYSSWKISFFTLLTSSVVMSILSMGMMGGIYLEISSPGFGVFGSIAIFCLALILTANFAIYTINLLEIILFSLGAVLLLIELFVIPGFGLIGILGIICLASSFVAFIFPSISNIKFSFPFANSRGPGSSSLDSFGVNLSFYEFMDSFTFFLIALIITAVFCVLFSRMFLYKSKFFKKLILSNDQKDFHSHEYVKEDLKSILIEKQGVAHTPLSPCGKIMIEGNLYEASSIHGFIQKGDRVKVLKVNIPLRSEY
jgi:membrane-bound serine protease (ClpP class)